MNYVSTKNAPRAIGPYSQAIKTKGFLFTSGQIAINPKSGDIESDTIEGQTRQVMENLKAVCIEAGVSLDKVVKTTCFLKNIEDFGTFNNIYEEYISNKPARSCVAVKDLPKGALVEVELIAEL